MPLKTEQRGSVSQGFSPACPPIVEQVSEGGGLVRTRPEGVYCKGPWESLRAPHLPLFHTKCFLILKEMGTQVENLEDV